MPTLLCDLGGVLFDLSFERVLRRWAEANGGRLAISSPAELTDQAFRMFETGLLGESEYARHLRVLTGWNGSDEDLVTIWNEAPGPVSLDVLDTLGSIRERGWRLVALTNTNPWHVEHLRSHSGWALSVFDDIVTSIAIRSRKPDPRFFASALRTVPRHGPRLCVDARPENVSAARRAGLDAHMFSTAQALRAACRAVAVAAS